MEEVATQIAKIVFSQYGVLGIVVVGLVLYILKKEKDHRDERRELVGAMQKQHSEALEVTRGNTTVLTEVKTLIQTIARK